MCFLVLQNILSCFIFFLVAAVREVHWFAMWSLRLFSVFHIHSWPRFGL